MGCGGSVAVHPATSESQIIEPVFEKDRRHKPASLPMGNDPDIPPNPQPIGLISDLVILGDETILADHSLIVGAVIGMKSFSALPMREGLPPSFFSPLISIIKFTTAAVKVSPGPQSFERCPYFLTRSGRALTKYCADFLNVRVDSSSVGSAVMTDPETLSKPRVATAARVSSSLSAGSSGGKLRLFARGSASYMLPLCTAYLRANGSTAMLDNARRAQVESVIQSADPANVQTMILAYKDAVKEDGSMLASEVDEPGFILVALVSFSCPPRLTTYNVLSRCRAMGVAVHFCSESSREAAVHVAKKLGMEFDDQEKSAVEVVDGESIPSLELSAIPRVSCVHSCDAQDVSNFLRRMCSAKRVMATLTMSDHFTPCLKWSHVAGIQGMAPSLVDGDVARSAPQFAGLKGVRPPAITPLDVFYAVEAIEISKNILYNNRASTLPPITEVSERDSAIHSSSNSPVTAGPLSRHINRQISNSTDQTGNDRPRST